MKREQTPAAISDPPPGSWPEVFGVALRLGLTSFGGPIAHLGYFREEYVVRRRWLDERAYADIVALCQVLPGPASSQVGMAVGLTRAGYPGALAAWLGFTLPSAIALVLFASGLRRFGSAVPAGLLEGLKVAAVAVVAQALLGMMRTLAPDRARATVVVASCAMTLAVPTAWGQIVALALGALAGALLPDRGPVPSSVVPPTRVSGRAGVLALLLFAAVLIGLPFVSAALPSHAVRLFDVFFRAGSLVFGGGHVVLPLLEAAVVPTGWIGADRFLAGYGAAQAVPGPLFTFAAFLGAAMEPGPNGWLGAALCLVAIFLPSFLLVVGALAFWHRLRRSVRVEAALRGVNAAVVGLLLAAFYDPLLTTAVRSRGDFILALAAFLLLVGWRAPPWLVVALSALAGIALAAA